jgi:hypothetical protein
MNMPAPEHMAHELRELGDTRYTWLEGPHGEPATLGALYRLVSVDADEPPARPRMPRLRACEPQIEWLALAAVALAPLVALGLVLWLKS